MELNNEQRKYLGLELIDPSWDRIEIPNNCVKPELSTGKDVLFFDGEVLRKMISIDDDDYYLEESCAIATENNRSMIAPKTNKGKPKRLNGVNLQRCKRTGVYFLYSQSGVTIANYTTQKTYFSSELAGQTISCEKELQLFLAKWIADANAENFEQMNVFLNTKTRCNKFKEGDFFRFLIDRTHYGYGRILLDINKMRVNGEKFWDILMGKPLVVSVYHIITQDSNVSTDILKSLKSCPSQFIFDNRFYYGEYEIIAHEELGAAVDYPIMYGTSISGNDKNKIQFQQGHIYKEIPLQNNKVLSRDFINNRIGYSLKIDKNILQTCINQSSNEPYWNRGTEYYWQDLRHPKYKQLLGEVLEQMGTN